MNKIAKNILAVFLLLLGVIGGAIPFLQGWVFVLLGYIMLDFKKKEYFEKKIVIFLAKRKITKNLARLWLFVKRANRSLLNSSNSSHKKIRELYKGINKDVDKK